MWNFFIEVLLSKFKQVDFNESWMQDWVDKELVLARDDGYNLLEYMEMEMWGING